MILALFLWGGAFAIQSTGSSQQDAGLSEREQIAAALKLLKSGKADHGQEDQAMVELLFLGLEGPKSLAAWLERELKARVKTGAKEERRILIALERRAKSLIEKRLTGAVEREVDQLRSVVLRHARNAALTKATIQNESDPAVERLNEILTIDVHSVWTAEPELREQWEALLDARDREFLLLENWRAAYDAIMANPSGGERVAKRLSEPQAPTYDADGLMDEADRLAQLATPMSQGDRRVFDANWLMPVTDEELPPEGQVRLEEKLGVRFLNLRRVLLGLSAQSHDIKLSLACRGHSKDMAEHDFFSHDSPLKGKETPWARAGLAGTSASSENIARGASEGSGAILQWWYSPGHHRNMMGGGSRTGLGQFGNHWTQLFGG